MKYISLFLVICLTGQSFAAECPNAIDLSKGATVTDCDRVGLSKEYAAQVRKELIEGDYNRQIVEEQKRLINIKDLALKSSGEQVDLWRSEAGRSREQLDRERSRGNLPIFIGFLSGVAMVLASAWAVKQVGR